MIVDFPEKRSPGARLDLKGAFGSKPVISTGILESNMH